MTISSQSGMTASMTATESTAGQARRLAGAFADGLARRARMIADKPPIGSHRPSFRLFVGELSHVAEPIRRWLRPEMPVARAEHPRVVILLPGFATNPRRMRFMARDLERAGHTVKQWGQGYNLGPSPENFDQLARRVCEVRQRYGQQVYLVGWSLGGIFAREVAKRHPECVAKVVTLGSPFSHSPYSNNVWRTYQMVTGHSVAAPPVEGQVSRKPPVETVALWSPRDGVIAPRSACGTVGERDRAHALRCSHMGFCDSPQSISAVLRELA